MIGKRPPTKRIQRARHLGVRVVSEANLIEQIFRHHKSGKDRRRRIRQICPSSSSSSSACTESPTPREEVGTEATNPAVEEEEVPGEEVNTEAINPAVEEMRDVLRQFAEFLRNECPYSKNDPCEFVEIMINFWRSSVNEDLSTLAVVSVDDMVAAKAAEGGGAPDEMTIDPDEMTTGEVIVAGAVEKIDNPSHL